MNTPTHSPASKAPSAQTDCFVHDRLPSPDQLPKLLYPLPELRIPDQANLVDVLFSRAMAQGQADKPFLRSDRITLSYHYRDSVGTTCEW